MGFLSIYAALCCIALRVRAVVVQDDWVFPQGPDKSSTLDLDDPYTVQWTTNLQSWFPKYAPNANTSNLDLWVTGEHTVLGYHKLMAGLDANSQTSFRWTVTLPLAELANETVWVFRFLAANDDPVTGTGNQISSPLFYVSAPVSSISTAASISSSTSTSSVTTKTVQTSSTSTSISTSTPTSSVSTTPNTTSVSSVSRQSTSESATTTTASVIQTSTSSQAEATATPVPENELSMGAKVGIGVGAAAGAVVLLSVLIFFLWSRHNRRTGMSNTPPQAGKQGKWQTKPMEVQSDVTY